MQTVPDLLTLARRIDGYADDADERQSHARADELRELAAALRAKHSERVRTRVARVSASGALARSVGG